MGNSSTTLNIMKFAGAYIAFTIGSGFATGQEIMQFFTSNGLWSICSIIISLILFIYFGSTIMVSGFDYSNIKKYRPYKYFCGKYIGSFYEYFVPVLLFLSVIIMISGSGATLKEYYGFNYYIGCAMMALLVLIAFLGGLESLINIIGIIGPVIVIFSLIVGFYILFHNLDGLRDISFTMNFIEMPKSGGNWLRSGIIYAAYNLVGGVLFFSTLGASANTRQEAKWGGIIGSASLMFVIFVMNLALLSKIKNVSKLAIPTLYFAKSISPIFGNIFSVILLCGIFSTAAPNFWTVCEKVSIGLKLNSKIVSIVLAVVSFFGGLFPFEKLVEKIYPLTGILGVILFVCILYKQLRKKII